MSMCRVFSRVAGSRCLLWPVWSLGKTLLAFALLHFFLKGQICLLVQISLDFLLLHSSPLWWNEHLFGCFFFFFLEGLIGLFIELFNFSFFSITGWGIDSDFCDIECFALETNRDHSVVKTAAKYCISDSLVDYEGYSISSKGFCPQ